MPKVGPYKIPNHDIDTVVELIDEAATRLQQVQAEAIDEETFQDQVIQRHGGSYNRYRFSLQLYGFLDRQHGADEVELTDLFVDVADPIPKSKRTEAIIQALENVPVLWEMHEADFDPDVNTEKLRVWLVQGLNIPREDADEEVARELKKLYEPAYSYLEQASEDDEEEPDETESPETQDEPVDSDGAGDDGPLEPNLPPGSGGSDGTEYEEFHIGDRYVRLPKENLAQEWELLKATVDAYVNGLESEDNGS